MMCKKCTHFVFAVNPETGRKLPSLKGQCGYKVPWPEKIPKSYQVKGWNSELKIPLPYSYDMWPDDDSPCPCFELKMLVKRNTSKKMVLFLGEEEGR